ncbi:MAG TPA: tetratricopeptide repeat protein [Pirellulales bacterium]|jgi:tetratricopeptide (TPR) repeat protein
MLLKLLIGVLALAADGSTAPSGAAESTAAIEAPKYHVGSRVIVIHETLLRVDDHPVKQLEPGTPLRVEELNDQGFLGVTAGRAGWVDAADVVPLEDALEPLTQLIAQDADNVHLHQARAVIAEAKKNWDLAIEDFTALMRLQPDQSKYYLMRGDAWLEKKETDKALADLNEAVTRDENPAFALLKRGYLWAQRKELDKALADFNEALGHDLDDSAKAEVLSYRGSVYLDQNDFDKSFADFDAALKLDPRNATNFVLRGSAYYRREKYQQAIADYSAALWAQPDNPTTYTHRGYAFWRNGEPGAAEADFEKAIKLDPANRYALGGRASLRASKKEFDRALADFNECVRLDPSSAEPLVNRADTYGLMKQYDKQIADYREAIKLAPDEAMAHNNLAWILATCPEEKFRNGTEAVEQGNKAVELTQNKQGEFIDTLAAAYAEAGDFDKAADYQQKAIDLVSDEKTRKGMHDRLELFQKHEPYRETPGEQTAAN